MCDGTNAPHVVLMEDHSLLQSESVMPSAALTTPSSAVFQQQQQQQDLNSTMTNLVRRGNEDQIIDLVKNSTLEEISAVNQNTWETMVPVLQTWASQSHFLDRQIMAFSLAYHVMQACPNTFFRRQDLVTHVARLSALCNEQVMAGIEFSQMGGLSFSEMRQLNTFLKNKS